jgi:hypothetical protein
LFLALDDAITAELAVAVAVSGITVAVSGIAVAITRIAVAVAGVTVAVTVAVTARLRAHVRHALEVAKAQAFAALAVELAGRTRRVAIAISISISIPVSVTGLVLASIPVAGLTGTSGKSQSQGERVETSYRHAGHCSHSSTACT